MKAHLNNQLYKIISESIKLGSLKKGYLLLEGPLAELFGVSRSPVRQALNGLHEDGLICTFEGRGYLVGDNPDAVIRVKLKSEHFQFDPASASAPRKIEAWREVYDCIEREFLHQSLFGSYRINELELSRHYAISRTVSNQVLTRLSMVGLIERDERSRWILQQWDEERLGELYELRRHMEPYVLRRAVMYLRRDNLQRYIHRLEQAIAQYPDMDSSQFDELEHDLHIETLGHCPNKHMLQILQRTHSLLLSGKHILLDKSYFPDEEPFFHEHLNIFKSLLNGRVDLAVQSMTEHLLIAERKVKQRMAYFREHNRVEAVPFLEALEPA